jgi:hypothetical protein
MALANSSMRATFAPKISRHANTVAPKRAAMITRAAALELPDSVSKVGPQSASNYTHLTTSLSIHPFTQMHFY